MYSFAQRKDIKVFDEPLYAHYLANSTAKAYHPGAEEILETMENDGNKVIQKMKILNDNSVVFFKHMSHHLVDLDWSFMLDMVNVILTRDPIDMLPSYAKQINHPSMRDVGYQKHLDILNFLEANNREAIIVDGKDVQNQPESILQRLCEALGISFDNSMLSWPAGPITEDGCWAKFWYHNVHKSTCFKPYVAKTEAFPDHLKDLLSACQPIYQSLKKNALRP